MPSEIIRAIIKTLSYSDVFDYPLTEEEIWRWLIKVKYQKSLPRRQAGKIKNTIKKLKIIKEKDGYYFLKGREKIVALRKKRKKYSQEKLKVAHKVINVIKIIPFVKLVGITGALAVDNAKKDDDIDLFIITSRDLLWTTRLFVTLLAEIIGMRRHPSDVEVNNKICLNMFVDEEHLEISKKEQDLFSAHEVLQMKPLFDRDNTYQKFLAANKWAEKYLPNSFRIAVKTPRGWPVRQLTDMTPPMVEGLVKSFQLWYMRNRRTTEVIKEGIIRFHPHDAREWVMREYKKRLRFIGDYKDQ